MVELTAEHLFHIYLKGTPLETLALTDVSLTITSDDFIAIMGKTGAGKSTFVQHFNGILKPSGGRVLIGGADINGADKKLKHTVGLVFQFPETQLFEENVFDDIAFGPRNLGWNEQTVREAVEEAVAAVDPTVSLLYAKSPFVLSGGEQRKVAICGIIAMRPQILCLDEPAAGLDPRSKEQLFESLSRLHQNGTGIVIITHDINDAVNYAHRVVIMHNGTCACDVSVPRLLASSEIVHEYGIAVPDSVLAMQYMPDLFASAGAITEKEIISRLTAHARNEKT